MDYLRVRIACWMLFLPVPLLGQAIPSTISCVDADSALGPLTTAQSRALLRRTESARGTFVTTVRLQRSETPLVFAVSWTSVTIAEPLGPEIIAALPKKTVANMSGTGASVVLLVDEWLSLPLGPPTPATMDSNVLKYSENYTVSSLLTEEDLRSLAVAKSATIQYFDKRIVFDTSDLAAANALYRTVRCARAAARSPE